MAAILSARTVVCRATAANVLIFSHLLRVLRPFSTAPRTKDELGAAVQKFAVDIYGADSTQATQSTESEVSVPQTRASDVSHTTDKCDDVVAAAMEQLQDVDFPHVFSGDALSALSNNKIITTEHDTTTKFRFKCTGCGACCRGFSDTVMLDPYDIYCMHSIFPSNAAGGILTDKPDNFTHGLGRFSGAALDEMGINEDIASVDTLFCGSGVPFPRVSMDPALDGSTPHLSEAAKNAFCLSENTTKLQHMWGLAPVMYLRSKDVSRGRRTAGRAHRVERLRTRETETVASNSTNANKNLTNTHENTEANGKYSGKEGIKTRIRVDSGTVPESNAPVLFSEGDRDRVCAFATPHYSTFKHENTQTTQYGTADHKEKGGSKGKPGLSCSLGPAGMPGACVLYPLGELWTSSTAEFYTLDATRCEGITAVKYTMGGEGVGADAKAADMITAAQYREARQLGKRKAVHEWFKQLATTVAIQQYDQQIAYLFDANVTTAAEISFLQECMDRDASEVRQTSPPPLPSSPLHSSPPLSSPAGSSPLPSPLLSSLPSLPPALGSPNNARAGGSGEAADQAGLWGLAAQSGGRPVDIASTFRNWDIRDSIIGNKNLRNTNQRLSHGRATGDDAATIVQESFRYIWYAHPALRTTASWDAVRQVICGDTRELCAFWGKRIHEMEQTLATRQRDAMRLRTLAPGIQPDDRSRKHYLQLARGATTASIVAMVDFLCKKEGANSTSL